MEFEIGLQDIKFYAFLGVEEFERVIGNEFVVSLFVKKSFHKVMEKDDISNSISYVDLYEIVNEEIKKPRKLLETVAVDISYRIKEKFGQEVTGKIKIEKVHPPIPGMLGKAYVCLSF